IGLNGKNVGQIAIVIFCPNVLVVARVDQLHVNPDAIATATDATFQKRGYAQRLANFARVTYGIAPIRHDRHTRDDLQVADLGEICQDIILHAVGEVRVLLFIAEALKGQDGNRFLDVAPGSAREQEKSGNRRNGKSGGKESNNVAAPMHARNLWSGLNSLRSHVVGPGEDERDWKTD